MKKTTVLTLILQFIITSVFAQSSSPNRYEVETLVNPNAGKKDTREVNAVLIFEKDGIKIQSRRSKEIFKEFKYSDIRSAQHSYSKWALLPTSNGTAAVLSVLSGMSIFLRSQREDKHWLTVATDNDFAVLKIENDNYRLIRMELIIKKVDIVDINENRQ